MDYKKQADNFLAMTGVNMTIEKAVPQLAPQWAENGQHGIQYSIELSRNGKKIQFFFWNSISAKEAGKKPVSYDILAGLYVDNCEDFADFCDTFGYDTDSKKAERTYFEVLELNSKLKSLFTSEELEKLAEIT